MIKHLIIGVMPLLIFNLSACSPVAPWERGHLALHHMALEANPTERMMREHTYSSREAASGGNAASGGGCGCY